MLMRNLLFAFFSFVFILASFYVSAQDGRAVRNFHAVANAGGAEVYVTMGNEESLRMVGDDEDVERIETVVQNGVLRIRIKRDFNNWNIVINPVKIYITAVKLDGLMQSGSGSIELEGVLDAAKADIQLSGSGKIVAALDVQNASITLSGSGGIVLAGKAGSLNMTMAGSGDLNADKLEVKTTKIKIAGNGVAYVNVSERIEAKLVGPGQVKYIGNPEIITSKIGAGSVSPM